MQSGLLLVLIVPMRRRWSETKTIERKTNYSLTRNTLDCDQSNYSARIIIPTYLLHFVKPELAPFDPPTPKTPP